jgi:membrane protease YdiL (CAAX protease family)
MQNLLKNKDLKISLIFTAIGIIASTYAGLYQISMFTEDIKQQVVSQLGSIEVLIPIAAVQGGLITFIATFIGVKIARKVNLKLNFKFDKKAFLLAILIGLITALIITGSDSFIFAKYLPDKITTYEFSLIYLITGILYGGIIEEILLRLLVMSLFVLILWKLFARAKDNLNIPNWIYITAIILASVLFAAGHIPFTAQSFGLSVPIIIRCFVLNGIGGLGFGYLYWKKGLAYSMIAHASTHVFMQVLFMPLLF